MKLKHIALAALSAVALQAQAAQPQALNQYTFYIAGSSALTPTLKAIFANNAVGGVTTFEDAASGTNYWIWQATVSHTSPLGTALGLGADTLVTIFKRDAGGSIQGVNPVALGNQVSFLSETSTFNASNVATTQVFKNANVDLGVADLEPSVLQQAINLPSGTNPLSAAQLGNLTTTTAFLQSFGVAVNNNLYTALQSAQGTSGTPTISLSQVQSLVNSGTLYNDGVNGWGYLIGGNNLSQVNIVRRTAGSGTQATANILFSNTCSTSPETPLDHTFNDATTYGSGGSLYVVEGSSTGAVKSGLDAADAAGAGVYAIGYISYDNQPGASDTWKFVNLDGFSPNIANVEQGNYLWAFENTFNYNTAYYNAHALSKAFVNGYLAEATNPATITALPAASQNAIAEVSASHVTRHGNSCRVLEITN